MWCRDRLEAVVKAVFLLQSLNELLRSTAQYKRLLLICNAIIKTFNLKVFFEILFYKKRGTILCKVIPLLNFLITVFFLLLYNLG